MARIAEILLASDLTDRSWCPLVRAIQLKRATAARLTLLHVADGGLADDVARSHRATAMATMEGLLARAGGAKLRRVDIRILPGDPVAVVVAEAESRSVDLVVLGEPGKPRIRELVVGTTAERVVRHSRCPVLVAKVCSDQPYRRAVVAFDASLAAERALATALALAPRAEFRLVHAWQGPGLARAGEDAERARVLLETAARQTLRRSLYPHTNLAVEVRDGAPAAVVADELASFGPDLLAMGTHGRSRLGVASRKRCAGAACCQPV